MMQLLFLKDYCYIMNNTTYSKKAGLILDAKFTYFYSVYNGFKDGHISLRYVYESDPIFTNFLLPVKVSDLNILGVLRNKADNKTVMDVFNDVGDLSKYLSIKEFDAVLDKYYHNDNKNIDKINIDTKKTNKGTQSKK